MAKNIKLTNKFWDYEMGASMKETVDAWDQYIKDRDRTAALNMQMSWEAFQISFRYIFGFDVHFTRTDEFYGICDDDENFFYKVDR